MIRIVKMTFQEEHIEDFKALFESIKTKIKACEGCEHLRLLQDEHRPNIFFTYSIWQALEHLESYRNSDLFITTWKNVKPWFAAKAEAWSVAEISNV